MIDLFTPFSKVEFLKKKFDFVISPSKFIKWLRTVDEDFKEGSYSEMVGSMCEFSCLYISMLLFNKELKGQMYVCFGYFGRWEHYWIEYDFEGKTYLIDLTLQQFYKSPKLAISLKAKHENAYCDDCSRKPLRMYCEQVKAFDFYTNPINMKPAPMQSYDFTKAMNNKVADLMGALDEFDC